MLGRQRRQRHLPTDRHPASRSTACRGPGGMPWVPRAGQRNATTLVIGGPARSGRYPGTEPSSVVIVRCANWGVVWCYGGGVAKDDGGRLGVAAALVRGAFLVNAVYAESARECGLTAQQGQLLCVLMAQPYGMGELSVMLGLAKSSLTGLVDRTERNGLVRREGDSRDTRAVWVALTPQGGALVEKFYAETSRRVERLAAGLGETEREELGRLLGRVVLDNEVPVVFVEMDSPAFHGSREE